MFHEEHEDQDENDEHDEHDEHEEHEEHEGSAVRSAGSSYGIQRFLHIL
jgi:hypothetical protein